MQISRVDEKEVDITLLRRVNRTPRFIPNADMHTFAICFICATNDAKSPKSPLDAPKAIHAPTTLLATQQTCWDSRTRTDL